MTDIFAGLESPEVLDAAALDALARAFAWHDAISIETTPQSPPNSWVIRHRNPTESWLRNYARTQGMREATRFLTALRRLDHQHRAAIVQALRRSD
jgi:hypothetical protein